MAFLLTKGVLTAGQGGPGPGGEDGGPRSYFFRGSRGNERVMCLWVRLPGSDRLWHGKLVNLSEPQFPICNRARGSADP